MPDTRRYRQARESPADGWRRRRRSATRPR